MTVTKKSKASSRQNNKINNELANKSKLNKKDQAYSIVVLVALCALIFYPPFVRGMFFNEDLYLHYILTGLVFMLVWIDKVNRGNYRILSTPMEWAVLAYVTAYLLSLLTPVHPGEAVHGFLKVFQYALVFWMVSQMVRTERAYRVILQVLLASAVGVAGIGVLAATGYSQYPAAFDGRVILSTLQYPNTTAAFLAVAALIGATLWVAEKRRWLRLVYVLADYILLVVMVATLSKGAWVIYASGILLFIIGMPGIAKLKSTYFLMLTGVVALLVSVKFMPAILAKDSHTALLFLSYGVLAVIIGEILWDAILLLYNKRGPWFTAGLCLLLLLGSFVAVNSTAQVHRIGTSVSSIDLSNGIKDELASLVNTSDSSYSARMSMYQDAVSIIKDHKLTGTGAGGWKALYHQYQDSLYWSTEVHNHFLQVGVEAGLLGLIAYLAIWVMLVYMLVCSCWRRNAEGPGDNRIILYWGTATAALALGLHSTIDFDLSLGSMSVLLFVLLALVNSSYYLEGKVAAKPVTRVWLPISGWVLLTVFVLVSGQRFYVAARLDLAAQDRTAYAASLNDPPARLQEIDGVIEMMKSTTGLDPYNALYQARLAEGCVNAYTLTKSLTGQDAASYLTISDKAMDSAQSLALYDVKVRSSLMNNCVSTGNTDAAAEHSRAIVAANPNDANAYNSAIQLSYQVADKALASGNKAAMKPSLQHVISIDQRLEAQKKRVDVSKPWLGVPLALNSEAQYAVARAYYLLGDYARSKETIEPLLDGKMPLPTDPAVRIWYAACLEKQGKVNEANIQLQQVVGVPNPQQLYDGILILSPIQ